MNDAGTMGEEIVHGPCHLISESGHWGRRNTPAACDNCRRKRTKCLAYIEGAPCSSCKKSATTCFLQGVSYPSHRLPSLVYRSILPPPAVPASSPTLSSVPLPSPIRVNLNPGATELDFSAAVNQRYKVSGTRPAPLVWKSIDDVSYAKPAQSTTSTRARRSLSKPDSKSAVKFESDEDSELDDGTSEWVSYPVEKDAPYCATEVEEELVRPIFIELFNAKFGSPVVVKSKEWENDRRAKVTALISSYSTARSNEAGPRLSFPTSAIRSEVLEIKTEPFPLSVCRSGSQSSYNSDSPSPSTVPSYTATSERHFDWG